MMPKIPSDADFARAERAMARSDRHLNKVCENVQRRFRRSPLYNVFVFPQHDVHFRVYVFLDRDCDIKACQANGIITAIENAIYDELERYGRGKRGDMVVAFEYDSNENVQKTYGGDYVMRLK